MLRDRLKDMDLRITELSDYLQISRPTMYKFIDYYEQREFDLINKKVLKLFNYITENELVGKKTVINYILNNLVDIKELGDKEESVVFNNIKRYITSNPHSKKSEFVQIILTKDTYDKLIFYIMDIKDLLKKQKLTKEEETKLMPYLELINKI